MTTILGFETYDVRFPTSRMLDGSDAMNPDPDYSAAALILRTDAPDGAGRARACRSPSAGATRSSSAPSGRFEPFLAGLDLDEVLSDLGGLARRLAGDSPLRWLGPERGVVHMAIGAVLNACWDLAARRAGKPLWLLLAELSPEEIVSLVDFRYLSDVLTPDDALALLERGARRAGRTDPRPCWPRATRPTPPPPAGWAIPTTGSPQLCAEAVQGRLHPGQAQGRRRVSRMTSGASRSPAPQWAMTSRIALDANQVWDVDDAIAWVRELAPSRPNGSRSRPARTTSLAPPRSAAPCTPCGWPPASTSPTG